MVVDARISSGYNQDGAYLASIGGGAVVWMAYADGSLYRSPPRQAKHQGKPAVASPRSLALGQVGRVLTSGLCSCFKAFWIGRANDKVRAPTSRGSVTMGLFDGLKKAIGGSTGLSDGLASVEAENAALIKLYQERVTRINSLEVVCKMLPLAFVMIT